MLYVWFFFLLLRFLCYFTSCTHNFHVYSMFIILVKSTFKWLMLSSWRSVKLWILELAIVRYGVSKSKLISGTDPSIVCGCIGKSLHHTTANTYTNLHFLMVRYMQSSLCSMTNDNVIRHPIICQMHQKHWAVTYLFLLLPFYSCCTLTFHSQYIPVP